MYIVAPPNSFVDHSTLESAVSAAKKLAANGREYRVYQLVELRKYGGSPTGVFTPPQGPQGPRRTA